ncbi:hypothetical protein AURDEDRAFT_128347 [Auricularia subglabra TFB-10046 SS5]|nr:hypothetical protein AURDEDRAFT_128347 [Auricularia subglabra TFB-10046 SS5]
MGFQQPVGGAAIEILGTGLSRIPPELHSAWLRYLTQPEILRVGLLSKSWRALVLEEPHFYLAVRLQAIRGRHKRFIRQLQHAAGRKLPVGVILDFPYAPTKISRGILASAVSPEIVRSMTSVKKLSVVSGAPLPAPALEFLQAPAPLLRDFTYRIDPDLDGEEEEYDSASDSDSGFYSYSGWSPTTYARLPPIGPRLFACSAPRLTRVDLYGVTLPDLPAPAFGSVKHAKLGELQPIPAIGLGVHFPAARHLKLTTLEDDFPKSGTTCGRASWLPAWLVSFNLDDSAILLPKLMQHADLAAVPHLTIDFNSHYHYEYTGGVSVLRSPTDTRRFDERDADWAACLAHLASPMRLAICSVTSSIPPDDVRVSVSAVRDPSRTVTFYADECFVDRRASGASPQYSPLASLKCLSADLEEISVEHAHLPAIFCIAKTLPLLRKMHIALGGSGDAQFWTQPAGLLNLACPTLEQLTVSSDTMAEGVVVQSDELAQFGRALGFSAATRPRLVLRGVSVEGGAHHDDLFTT